MLYIEFHTHTGGGCNSSNFVSKDVLRNWAEELGLCIPISTTTISSMLATILM